MRRRRSASTPRAIDATRSGKAAFGLGARLAEHPALGGSRGGSAAALSLDPLAPALGPGSDSTGSLPRADGVPRGPQRRAVSQVAPPAQPPLASQGPTTSVHDTSCPGSPGSGGKVDATRRVICATHTPRGAQSDPPAQSASDPQVVGRQ